MKCLFSSIYWSDESMKAELEKIERKIQEITEEPVLSSGHAFICFDSLKAAYSIITEFKEGSFNQIKFTIKSIFENCKRCFQEENVRKDIFGHKGTSTFQRFNEEYGIDDLEANFDEENNSLLIDKNVDILVDQLDVEKDKIAMESSIIGDLGADSLDVVDLIMTLEEELQLQKKLQVRN